MCVKTSMQWSDTVHQLCLSLPEKVVLGTVPVYSGTVWTDEVYKQPWLGTHEPHETTKPNKENAPVVFNQHSLLNQNMAVQCRCWSLKADQKVVVDISKIKKINIQQHR